MKDFSKTLRTIYMYLVSLISVVVFVIGAVTLINTALKSWVFPTTGYYYYEDPVMTCKNEAKWAKEDPNNVQFDFGSQEECVAYYTEYNRNQTVNQRNMDIAFGIAMTTVSLPIWLLHMWFIKRDKKRA